MPALHERQELLEEMLSQAGSDYDVVRATARVLRGNRVTKEFDNVLHRRGDHFSVTYKRTMLRGLVPYMLVNHETGISYTVSRW